MYRIMLADDEGIVIDALKFIIEKSFGDTCVVEYAKTGRGVIELAESFRPDIAIMDIQMPGINGIEAIKEIQKNNSNIIFVVLTAHDRFDYAREAISLGVMEYVNKPINRDKMVDILSRAMHIIDTNRAKRRTDLSNKEKLETVIPFIESGFIYAVMFQENYAQEAADFKRLFEIEEDSGYMMVIECGDLQEEGQLENAIGVGVRIHSHYSRLKEIVKEFFKGIVGPMMANAVIVFVPCEEKGEEEYEGRIQMIENARKMVRKLNRVLDASFRVGIGSVKRLEQIGDSYTEAINAFHYTTSSVAHAKDFPMGCGYEEDYPIDIEQRLFSCLEAGEVNGAVAEAGKFYDWMVGSYAKEIMDIKLKALEFVLFAEKIGYESGGTTYRFTSRHDYLPSLMEFRNYDELRAWFLGKIREAAKNVRGNKESTHKRCVEQAIEYIRERYHKSITLDEVSRQVNVSPYYFSKLFKEETGENFIDYLTSMRMDKAKELLMKTDKSMKEICGQVGYQDPNYFSRAFKKNVGITPTEYKEGKSL